MGTNLGVEYFQSSLVLALRGKQQHRHRGHVTRPRHKRYAAAAVVSTARLTYLLHEIESPVPVVMAGQDVSALEPNRDLSATSTLTKHPTVGDLWALPASPSLFSGRTSSPGPLPPSSRTRGPTSGRPRHRPESERGPATAASKDKRGRGSHTWALGGPRQHPGTEWVQFHSPRRPTGNRSERGPQSYRHGRLLGLVIEARLQQAEGKHPIQIPEETTVITA